MMLSAMINEILRSGLLSKLQDDVVFAVQQR